MFTHSVNSIADMLLLLNRKSIVNWFPTVSSFDVSHSILYRTKHPQVGDTVQHRKWNTVFTLGIFLNFWFED